MECGGIDQTHIPRPKKRGIPHTILTTCPHLLTLSLTCAGWLAGNTQLALRTQPKYDIPPSSDARSPY